MRHQSLQVFLNLSKLIPYKNVELMQQVGGLVSRVKGKRKTLLHATVQATLTLFDSFPSAIARRSPPSANLRAESSPICGWCRRKRCCRRKPCQRHLPRVRQQLHPVRFCRRRESKLQPLSPRPMISRLNLLPRWCQVPRAHTDTHTHPPTHTHSRCYRDRNFCQEAAAGAKSQGARTGGRAERCGTCRSSPTGLDAGTRPQRLCPS